MIFISCLKADNADQQARFKSRLTRIVDTSPTKIRDGYRKHLIVRTCPDLDKKYGQFEEFRPVSCGLRPIDGVIVLEYSYSGEERGLASGLKTALAGAFPDHLIIIEDTCRRTSYLTAVPLDPAKEAK